MSVISLVHLRCGTPTRRDTAATRQRTTSLSESRANATIYKAKREQENKAKDLTFKAKAKTWKLSLRTP